MMADKNDILLHILPIIGIRVSDRKRNSREKFLSYFVVLLCSVFSIHWFSAFLYRLFTNKSEHIAEIAYFLILLQMVSISYILNKEKKNISIIISKLYSYKNLYMRGVKKSRLTNPFTITIILSPAVISLIITISGSFQIPVFWTFNYEIHNNNIIYVLTFYGNLVYYTCNIVIALVTFSLCVTFYRWGEILKSYNKLLNVYLKEETFHKTTILLKEFFNIVKILEKTNQVFTYPSFIVISYGLEMIFLVFYKFFLKREKMFKLENVAEVIFDCVCGFLTVICYSICSATIPETLIEIRKTAKYHITKLGNAPRIPRNVLFYLKRIEKENVIYISPAGMFSLTRQFILTAIGATLTYDLLIINFK